MRSGLDGAVDSTDAQSHSFESSTENITFQSRSATCNNDRSDESNDDEDIESSLECENTNDVEGKEKKSSREKMKEMLSNRRNKKLRKSILNILSIPNIWQSKNSWNSIYQGKCMEKLESNQNSM